MDTKELVERCKRGEEQAMGLLYTTYVRKMEHVSRKYVKNEADVQDIVHDNFVIIFTSIGRLKDTDKLESWIFTIVRNLSLKHLQQPFAVSMDSMDVKVSEEESIPDYSRLMTIIEQLPQGYKKVLKLSVLDGLSHKEIGEILGIEPHSSSSQLARAKVLVLRNVKRYGVLLLALIATIVSFLLPDREEEQKKIVEKTPKSTDEEVKPDSTKTESMMDNVLVPVQPHYLVTQHIYEQPDQDSVQTFIAEVIGSDTTAIQSVDTARHEPRIVPDMHQNGRLIADDYHIKKNVNDTWNFGVSFAGGSDKNLLASAYLPGSIGSGANTPSGFDHQVPDTIINTHTRYYMPLTFGFSLSKSLYKHWSIETGLRYTLLRSDITTITSVSDGSMIPTTEITTQKLHYIGIPLKLTYSLWNTRQFSIYTTGGAVADIPIGTSNPVLWSVNFGSGIQYKITPSVSLYTEPSLNYYLNSGSGTPTIHTDRPFEFTIPVGFRISW